ncbi:craniofacial development protein 2 [Nephila pilipes]|uniref:Craniofacial development protein 2 n=1 Tax=Nephila pilipes TaxID=299642 RepID=A0A8X6U7B8_NEPPI|nr:craniofacial development protein 2 [Nephila pilipes]
MEFRNIVDREPYKIGTWNVKGLTEKKWKTYAELERENVDLVVLTETKITKSYEEEYGNYIVLHSSEGNASAGVSIFLKKDFGRHKKWDPKTDRIITAVLNVSGHKLKVIGVYGTNENAESDIKNKFQKDLEETLKHFLQSHKEHEFIMLGDFNSRVGVLRNSKVVGKFGDYEKANLNGRWLIDLCERYNLKIQNTFFEHEDNHTYTWYSYSSPSKTVIDFCITRQDTSFCVHDVLACPWYDCGSDHVFLQVIISFPLLITEMRRYREYMLYSDKIRSMYKNCLDSVIDLNEKKTTKEKYQNLKESIHLAAAKVLGIPCKHFNGDFLWDKEMKKLRAKQLSFTEKCICEGKEWANEQVLTDKIKNEVWEGICSTITDKNNRKKSEVAWNIINHLIHKIIDNEVQPQPSEEFYRIFFECNHIHIKEFQEGEEEERDENVYETHPWDVTDEDVTKALDTLYDDNHSTPGGLSIHLLKCSSDNTKRLLTMIINDIFSGKEIPSEITETYISDMKKDKSCDKYVIGNEIQAHSIMKIMGVILKKRLQESELEIFDFEPLKNHLYECITFLLRNLLQKYDGVQNKNFHLALINLRQTFFGIEYKKLFTALENYITDKRLLQTVKHLYKLKTLRVITSGKCSRIFTLSKGLIERSDFEYTLFKMFVKGSIDNWRNENFQKGIQIEQYFLSNIMYRDELIIISESHKTLEKMVLNLEQCILENLSLHVSLENVKYLGNKELILNDIKIEGENTLIFKNSIFELDGTNVEEVHRKCLDAKKAIRFLHPVVRDESIKQKIKKKIYHKIIRSILIHNCETWTLTKPLRKDLDDVELSYWKWLFLNSIEERTTSKLIEKEMIVRRVSSEVDKRKNKWWEDVQQNDSCEWLRSFLKWVPEGEKNPGSPKKRWDDGMVV